MRIALSESSFQALRPMGSDGLIRLSLHQVPFADIACNHLSSCILTRYG